MTNPTPGQNYTVVDKDWLRTIASRAYGNERLWWKIYKANRETIGANPDAIKPGQVLFIPPEEEKQAQAGKIEEAKRAAKGGEKGGAKTAAIYLNGVEYPSKRGRFAWAFDTMASSFNAEYVWNPGKDPGFDEATKRGSFADARLYLLGKLVCTGSLYTRESHIGVNEITKTLTFYSKTKDVVDTFLSPKWCEMDNSTLKQIADEICAVLGVQAKFVDDPGKPFETIEGVPNVETVGSYFQKLASSRGLFVSSDEHGALVFQKFNDSAQAVAHIEYPGRIATDWAHTYDDTQRFYSYVAFAKLADGKEAKSEAFLDPQVPGARQMVFAADNAAESLGEAAEWVALRLYLKANELKVPVSGWTDSDGNLWTPNTAVTVKAPVLDVPETRKMIIRGCEFEWSADSRTAVLSLLPVPKIEGGKLVAEGT
jgi:prophage tail gpP-like protein